MQIGIVYGAAQFAVRAQFIRWCVVIAVEEDLQRLEIAEAPAGHDHRHAALRQRPTVLTLQERLSFFIAVPRPSQGCGGIADHLLQHASLRRDHGDGRASARDCDHVEIEAGDDA